MSNSLKATCPRCATVLEVEDFNGEPITCPSCRLKFNFLQEVAESKRIGWGKWAVLAVLAAFGLGILAVMGALSDQTEGIFWNGLLWGFFLLCGGLIYFLPALIAHNRKHKNRDPIFLLNLFLGWTFLGWVIALIWANTYQGERR